MIEPNELLELTKNHKEIWYKNEIPITQEEKRYYKCANPDGPVDNTLCPESDPHCNCPCKELQPRDAFIKDLTKYIQDVQNNGHMSILLGDFNEVLGVTTKVMTKFTADLNLLNLMLLEIDHADFAMQVRGEKERLCFIP